MQHVKVKGRTLSYDGRIIGTCNDNPILNTLTCNVEFEDGDVIEYVASTIGENMLIKTDTDSHITMQFQTMFNHRKYETSCKLKDKNVYVNSPRKLRKSAEG